MLAHTWHFACTGIARGGQTRPAGRLGLLASLLGPAAVKSDASNWPSSSLSGALNASGHGTHWASSSTIAIPALLPQRPRIRMSMSAGSPAVFPPKTKKGDQNTSMQVRRAAAVSIDVNVVV